MVEKTWIGSNIGEHGAYATCGHHPNIGCYKKNGLNATDGNAMSTNEETLISGVWGGPARQLQLE
jgi:hypothetical protein